MSGGDPGEEHHHNRQIPDANLESLLPWMFRLLVRGYASAGHLWWRKSASPVRDMDARPTQLYGVRDADVRDLSGNHLRLSQPLG